MVQKKVSNKLGIQPTNLLQIKTNTSLHTHDVTKKMKKSAWINRADLGLGILSQPKAHQAPGKPGKPAPLGAPIRTPSPMKASPSPNYMKSTSSSDARKEKAKVSKTLSRVSSLKKVRNLTKTPIFKHTRTGLKVNKCSKVVFCENLDVKRDTCSSTLKNSKFPPYVELNHGATESEGTSVMKVCPYSYCSLNGHHHKPRTPLSCFLSSMRKQLKTHKGEVAEVDQNQGFFLEISENALTPAQDQTSCDMEWETSDMEWEEGQGNISVQSNDEYEDKVGFKSEDGERFYFEDFIAEKLEAYIDEDDVDIECVSFADSVPGSESTQSGEKQIENLLTVSADSIRDSEKQESTADEIVYAIRDFQSIEEQDSFSFQHIDGITEHGNEGLGFYQESSETRVDEVIENDYPREDIEEEEDKAICASDELILREDKTKHTLPEIENVKEETSLSRDVCEVEMSQNEPELQDIIQSEKSEALTIIEDDCYGLKSVARYEACPTSAIWATDEGFIDQMSSLPNQASLLDEFSCLVRNNDPHQIKSNQEVLSKLKTSSKRKKEKDEGREFNMREPNFLPLQPDPEAEKVDLRHQEMDERRNAEEWMLDYALQKTVNQLAPARKRKVALLVEAFESVIPTPKYELHFRRSPLGTPLARPVQACS